jgi:hypothetical protein
LLLSPDQASIGIFDACSDFAGADTAHGIELAFCWWALIGGTLAFFAKFFVSTSAFFCAPLEASFGIFDAANVLSWDD